MNMDIREMKPLAGYIQSLLKKNNRAFAWGGYGENRDFYRRSAIFSGPEPRTVHLGIDFWVPEGAVIYMPLKGEIHSYGDNKGMGNYGPTIITRHFLDGKSFHLLWGHLSKKSIDNCSEKQVIEKGEKIGYVGAYNENGNWPPHLHFQIIEEIQEHSGDFPGVADVNEAEILLTNCPNPEILFDLP